MCNQLTIWKIQFMQRAIHFSSAQICASSTSKLMCNCCTACSLTFIISIYSSSISFLSHRHFYQSNFAGCLFIFCTLLSPLCRLSLVIYGRTGTTGHIMGTIPSSTAHGLTAKFVSHTAPPPFGNTLFTSEEASQFRHEICISQIHFINFVDRDGQTRLYIFIQYVHRF